MTTDKNIQTVKSIYAAFAKNDVPSIMEYCDENVQWGVRTPVAEVPWHRSFNGKSQVPSFFKALAEDCTFTKFEPTDILGNDTHVSCVVAFEATIKRTGRIVRSAETHHFQFKNNRIVQWSCDGSDLAWQNACTNGRTVIDNQIVAKSFFSCLDTRDLDGLVKCLAPTAKVHGIGQDIIDGKGMREVLSQWFRAFPDCRMPIEGVVANQNDVCVRYRFEGTQKETFMGIAPSNKRVSMSGTLTLRTNLENQVTECWMNADMLGLYTQLGAITPPRG